MNLLDFMREQTMQYLRYEDRDPNEPKQAPKTVKVRLVYGWMQELPDNVKAQNAKRKGVE
jgi:hypothetical protein